MLVKLPDKKTLEKEYLEKKEIYNSILYDFSKLMKKELEKLDIHFSLKYRAKSFDSYYKKYIKKYKEVKNKLHIEINDILGFRIICFFLEDLKAVEDTIVRKYSIVEEERKGDKQSFKEFGYSSIHFLIKLPVDLLIKYGIRNQMVCEIQIRTILQDAWAEVEHELVYKAEDTILNDNIKRKMAALNATLTLSDITFQEIRDMQKFLNTESKNRREVFLKKLENNVEFQNKTGEILNKTKINSKEKSTKKEMRYNNIVREQDSKISSKEDIKKNKDKIEKLLVDALSKHNQKEFKSAIRIYCDIIKLAPKQFVRIITLIHRGMAYFIESDYEEAILDFSTVLDEEPNNLKAMYYRGMIYGIKKEYEKSIKDFNYIVEKDPFNYKGWYGLAKIYYQMGDIVSAIQNSEKALKMVPEDEEIKKFNKMLNEKIQY